MNMWMNMDEYAGKGESKNLWSSEDEQQARTGKGQEQQILAASEIMER